MSSFWLQSKEARQERRLAMLKQIHKIENDYGSVMNCPKESSEYKELLKYSRDGWLGEREPFERKHLDELQIKMIEDMFVKKLSEGYQTKRIAVMLNISESWAKEIAREHKDMIRPVFKWWAYNDEVRVYARNLEQLKAYFIRAAEESGKEIDSHDDRYPWLPDDFWLKSGKFYWWEIKPGDVYITDMDSAKKK